MPVGTHEVRVGRAVAPVASLLPRILTAWCAGARGTGNGSATIARTAALPLAFSKPYLGNGNFQRRFSDFPTLVFSVSNVGFAAFKNGLGDCPRILKHSEVMAPRCRYSPHPISHFFHPCAYYIYARAKVKKLQTLFTKQGRVNNVKSAKIDFVVIFS